MKKKLKKILEITTVIVLIMTFVCCEKDNVEIIKQDNSIANVKSWLEKTNPSLKILDYTKTINWDNAIISNGDKGKITEIPILLMGNLIVKTIDNKDYYTFNRLMFLEKEGVINIYHIVITTTDINFDNNNKLFNFYSIPQDFFGFINVINTKNEITDTIDRIQKIYKIKNTYKTKNEIENDTCIILVEVFSDGSTTYVGLIGCFGGGGSVTGYEGTGYAGSGGSTGGVDTSTTNKTPCEALKEKLKALTFLKKLAELKTKTNLIHESGYDEKLDGTFTPLINTTQDGLLMPLTATTIGFNHNYINPYLNGKFDADGEPFYNEPIKMFSPADVGKFLEMIQNANNNGIPLDKIYGTMVTNNSTYTLSFTGDPNLIRASYGWRGMTEEYKQRMKGNLEDNFLKFIKDKVGIVGIVLSKLNTTNATVTTKAMNETGQIIKTNCN